MAKVKFNNVKISALSAVVGDICINIDDEKQYYATEKQLLRLKKSIGFNTRYVVNKDVTTYDLCLQAIKELFNKTGLTSDDFDAIISITQTPDYKMPGNAHLIHGELGFKKDCIAIDLELGCSSFIYGLFQAFMLCEKFAKRVLLLNGDTLSKIINIKNRADAPIFGDCGCATVIERDEKASDSYFILKSDGSGSKLMYQKAGGFRNPSNEETKKEKINELGNTYCDEDFYMSGGDVFTFTLTEQPPILKELLEFSHNSIDDIDYFIFHQANKFIVESIANNLNLPIGKVPVSNFSKYGNQSGASIISAICSELQNNFSDKEVILQGFGIGLSWGACYLKTNQVTVLPIQIYKKEG